jgi:hypothetical protein
VSTGCVAGGATVVTGGSGVCSVVVGATRVLTGGSGVRERPVVGVEAVVAPVAGVDVELPEEPLYCHWPCHDDHDGSAWGAGNATSGRPPIAVAMNECQICAGKVGPDTAIPCTLSIGISAVG